MPFNGFLLFNLPFWSTNPSDTFTTQKLERTLKCHLLWVHILSSWHFQNIISLAGNSPNILNVLINAHALIGNHQNSKCKNLLYFSNTRNWTVIADMLVWFLKWRRHQTFGTRARDLLCLMLYPTLECVISTGWSSSGCFPCRKIHYYGTQLNKEHQKLIVQRNAYQNFRILQKLNCIF
jgi:hypothetical protein